MHTMKRSWIRNAVAAIAILVSAIIQCASDTHGSQYSSNPSLDQTTLQAIVAELKTVVKGKVYVRGSYGYEKRRPVHNGACRHIYPAIIVVPITTEDVSYAVKAALKYNLPVSFRSGGHSFICQGIRQDALHIDVRQMDHVVQVSDHQIKFGSGANFGKILKLVSPERYTMIHGQSLTVGVAGFLQGLGVNPMGTSQRYGFGSDHVLEYTMVLADGSIARVNKYNTTILPSSNYGYNGGEVIPHTDETDLKYAMRASGGSFGIVTEFTYKIYPKPETLSCLLLVFIENEYDFKKLNKAAQDGRYSVTVFEPFFFRKPQSSHLLAWGLIRMPQIYKWMSRKNIEPTLVSVVDLRSPNRKTAAGPAITFMKKYGLRIANDNPTLLSRLGMDMVNFAVEDQDSVYLTPEERKAEGYHAAVSANMNGLWSTKAFQDTFFHHPQFGMYNRKSPEAHNTACDFCLYIIHFAKHGVNDNIIQDTEIGNIAIELTCTFNAKDKYKAKNCPKYVKHAKHTFTSRAYQNGEDPHQYVNTATCDDIGLDFGTRYWGNSYSRLLKIKQFWDPNRVFDHCHSVGSTRNDCCPI